jgi:hypothetical protein
VAAARLVAPAGGSAVHQLERQLRDVRAAVTPDPDPETWRSTAELLEKNERVWRDLFGESPDA